ncbi:hypothetical protein [Rhodopila sp.]|uniref:hypothetical protein n=1 Tax=Rhodopila sp. TaxID=2480087 RepID=UPI003D0A418E
MADETQTRASGDETRLVTTKGKLYLPGGSVGFPAGTEIALPVQVADELDAAGHLEAPARSGQ